MFKLFMHEAKFSSEGFADNALGLGKVSSVAFEKVIMKCLFCSVSSALSRLIAIFLSQSVAFLYL